MVCRMPTRRARLGSSEGRTMSVSRAARFSYSSRERRSRYLRKGEGQAQGWGGGRGRRKDGGAQRWGSLGALRGSRYREMQFHWRRGIFMLYQDTLPFPPPPPSSSPFTRAHRPSIPSSPCSFPSPLTRAPRPHKRCLYIAQTCASPARPGCEPRPSPRA